MSFSIPRESINQSITAPSYFTFPLTALHPGLWRHHCHPADLGRAALHRGQQWRQEPAHLDHLLRVGTLHAAADGGRHKVSVQFRNYIDCDRLSV